MSDRRERCAEVVLILAASLLAVVSARWQAASFNDGSRLALIESVVDRHTLCIDDSIFVRPPSASERPFPYQANVPLSLAEGGTRDKLFIDGHFYSDKPMTPGLLLAGLYQLLQWTVGLRAAVRPDWFIYLMTLAGNGPAYVLAVWSVRRLGRGLGLSAIWSYGLALSFAAATVAPAYLSYLTAHLEQLGLATTTFLLLDRLRRRPDDHGATTPLLLGLLTGLGYAIEQPTGGLLLAGVVLVVGVRRGVLPALLVGLGALPWLAVHHALTYAVAGTWRPINSVPAYFDYPGSVFDASTMTGGWNHPDLGSFLFYAVALLFGTRGFLQSNLPLLLTLPALTVLRRHRSHWPEALLAVGWAVGTWLVYAALSTNYSGSNCSIRWFVPLLAAGYYLLALLLRDGPRWHSDFVLLSGWGAVLSAVMWYGGTWAYDVPGMFEIQTGALLCWLAVSPNVPAPPQRLSAHAWALPALLLLAVVTLPPLLLERAPVVLMPTYAPERGDFGHGLAVLLLALPIAWRARLDRVDGPSGSWRTLALAAAALFLTALHYLLVDREPQRLDWQRNLYLELFNHTAGAPHQYRPLPYGLVRLLERLTGDWLWSCLAYRWFFSFWFLWASYRLARLVLPPERAMLALLPVLLLYPLAVARYMGQLADPLSHTLLVLSLLYARTNRLPELAAVLFLGVLAKETAVLVIPVYLVCQGQRWRAWPLAAGLTAVAATAFLLARLLVHPDWRPGYDAVNGTRGLMFGTNLGLGRPIAFTAVPLWENYLHPLLFVGPLAALAAWHWRRLDGKLAWSALVFGALLLASSAGFSWLYESRNYLPLVPLLATLALTPRLGRKAQ